MPPASQRRVREVLEYSEYAVVAHGPVERAEQCQRNTLRQHTVQTIAGVEPDRVIEPEAMVWLLADQVRPSAPTRSAESAA